MNWEMLKGIVERGITVAVVFAVGRNWVPAAVSADLVAVVVGALSVGYGWWVNRTANLVKSTASLEGVEKVVVDDPKLAAETTAPNAKVTTT